MDSATIRGAANDYDSLLASIGEAQVVALGEATHGTREFYTERGRISERLIREKNFGALLIEGNAVETERLNRYVRWQGSDPSAAEAMRDIRDFPRWMWRNAEFAAVLEQLRALNASRPPERRVGVYGMDVYNTFAAAEAVVAYARQHDHAAAARLTGHYRCILRYKPDPQRYAAATRSPARSCERAVKAAAAEVETLPAAPDPVGRDARFAAVRSAAAVMGGEEYYRRAGSGSYAWNARDRFMAATVLAVSDHLRSGGGPHKVIVWAHNSHVGDARATEAQQRGEITLGQALREGWGERAYLVGLLTYEGTAIAAREWGGTAERRRLRPALSGSHEERLNRQRRNLLLINRGKATANARALQRMVGVIYLPETERLSHYVQADLSAQFDAVLFVGQTTALRPL